MPDGKRNSIPPEGETEGVNCFYDDNDGIQNSNSGTKRLPLTLNTRGYHNLSERLLKAMVANEIKKTLDVEDNKRLVAHHRPVLHSENEASDSEMVVVGVVMNSKQSQNDEVSRAIEMLRRNGVNCVCFTIKDTPGGNGMKKDEAASLGEKGPSLEEKLLDITRVNLEQDENSESLSHSEKSQNLDAADKKVSSPTVSTTSDYASPHDDGKESAETLDSSCTSTTSPVLNTIENIDGPKENKLPSQKIKEKGKDDETKKEERTRDEDEFDLGPPALSPSPPILFPQDPVSHHEGEKSREDKEDSDAGPDMEASNPKETRNESTVMRRRKRRKRMYPYVSRRKSRNKKRKTQQPTIPSIKQEAVVEESKHIEEKVIRASEPVETEVQQLLTTVKGEIETSTPTPSVDPYEFEESDVESQTNTFKTPIGRSIPKVTLLKNLSSSGKTKSSKSKRSATKSKRTKGSPRKKLTFSKLRAFSPDITDSGSFPAQRGLLDGKKKNVDKEDKQISLVTESSCVQPISNENTKAKSNNDTQKPETDKIAAVPVAPENKNDTSKVKLVSLRNDDVCVEEKSNSVKREKAAPECDNSVEPQLDAQVPSNVQTKVHKVELDGGKVEQGEFLVPAPPNDSLQDAPDSMQLRRSSFYSSISRNVRTNLEKYLDGRPQDLKPPKRSKKVKNGFLLHHGDNFPDNPEAPYRLHLATQVLLKLNKRRVKFKPKEDKGKSLLSYLKLQPKRVSRVSKHSKTNTEEVEASTDTEKSSVFSGEWTVPRKFICNICGQVENAFWDMVMHKGEVHPGIVVTHVELSDNPPEGFRRPPSPRTSTTLPNPPPCSKCGSVFTAYSDLHRHIFECAGNATVLEEPTEPKAISRKKKGKRKRGFKRRISSLPKKNNQTAVNSKGPVVSSTVIKTGEITKRRNSEVFKCEFCAREFKTEGWLKNHVSVSHSLPISIPLEKLSLPTRASFSSSRRLASQLLAKASKQQQSRES